jgi:hypothetical protein
MSTSQTSILSKPAQGQQISPPALAYMRARAKRRAYDLVMTEFKRSGITKAELARRLFGNKGADRVSRMLGGPGNWTLKTLSDLLFAISGAEPTYGIAYPLEKRRRNYSGMSKYLDEIETHSDITVSKVSTEEAKAAEPEEDEQATVHLKDDSEAEAVPNPVTVKQLEMV